MVALGRRGLQPVGLAVVDYTATPVGPYREALVGRLLGPLSGDVPWIVVDGEASALAARAAWGLPKDLASFELGPALERAVVVAGAVRAQVTTRPVGPAVPLAVPASLRQPGRPPAPVRFRGRGRAALVRLDGQLPCGLAPRTRPGAVLVGTLHLGAPRGA